MENKKNAIVSGATTLGIEFGSTKIKAVLIDENHELLATGEHTWASRLVDGLWTYDQDEIWEGLHDAYQNLAADVENTYGVKLTTTGCLGISAMMHGYLAFDKEGTLLAPFRTWQNTNTAQAAAALSDLFKFNVPQRWSISHLYQAILNKEDHVPQIDFFTTLSGYVHWCLTGEKVLGIGDASGMFPIDSTIFDYDHAMVEKFDGLTKDTPLSHPLADLLPKVLVAGEAAGVLTEEGARLLDPTGTLKAGIPLCPPEGDAGTGMTATNAVKVRTGNVSAGTSIFSMVVLEKALNDYYEEIDMVTTPDGMPVAMVHCNNCTNDLNAWVKLLQTSAASLHGETKIGSVYESVYAAAEKGDPDCGGVVVCNFLAGEPVAGISTGVPLVMRSPEKPMTYENFCRATLYATLSTLKMGNDILAKEKVAIDSLMGHGGLFKNGQTGARFLADAVNASVFTMETAAVGGPYGMAVLAAYQMRKEEGETLPSYLENKVFAGAKVTETKPDPLEVEGFNEYLKRYQKMLKAEKVLSEMF